MSSTSQFTTFSDLYTAVMNASRSQTSQANTIVLAKRFVNVALQDVHFGTDRILPWTERRAVITTSAPYTTGTVSVTQGSKSVVGTDTTWNTSVWYATAYVEAEGKMKISGSDVVHGVASVATDTALTLEDEWNGANNTEAGYTYFKDTYTLASDFKRVVDMRFFDDHHEIEMIDRRQARRLFTNNSTPGRPRYATLVELGPSGNTALRPRLILYPCPNVATHIPYTYVTKNVAVASNGTLATALSGDSDEPVMPLQYRHVIYYGALKMMYEHRDDARLMEAKAMYESSMQRMLADTNVGDNRLKLEPRIGHYASRAMRPYSGSGRGGRYDTASGAFDRLG